MLGLIIVAGLCSQLAFAFLTPQQNAKLSELCSANPNLFVCTLAEYLDESMIDIDSLIPAEQRDSLQNPAKNFIGSRMQKRKSAFVRFGKRSQGNSEYAPEDLALNFPIDGILNSRPARKSSYIRFG
uniref:FMRFamide-like neuropeptides 14 n=1 Tax=Bursaphelenchus xylophilus TaxID=6326 RepID=A0A1I7S242_BURXY